VRQLKVLITGLGITAKSSFRRLLRNLLSKIGMRVEDIDGDYVEDEEMPEKFEDDTLYLIEDVHALIVTKEACLPLEDYNLILYLLPSFPSHLIFWLKRVRIWFELGKGSWDKSRKGWLGTGKPRDPTNIPLFIYLMLRDLWNRSKWIRGDKKVLSQYKVIFIRPQWTSKGIKFCLHHQF